MKLRQIPEDFIVQEEIDLEVSQEPKEFKVYMLEKSGLENFAVIRYLSTKNDVPSKLLDIAGLKDKHAVTRQHLSIPAKFNLAETDEKNLNLKFLGYSDKSLKVGKLIGNRFEIVVRDLQKRDLDLYAKNARVVRELGVPNYFDSQRFGSVIHGEFIAKYVIKSDYETAVKNFLTLYSRHEKATVKKEKREIKENWNNIAKLKVYSKQFAKIIDSYKKTGNWQMAYQQIPDNLREMFILAYQSYLWNECVKIVLFDGVPKADYYPVEYNIGQLFYHNKIISKAIPLDFPTICKELKANGMEHKIINTILLKEELKVSDFSEEFRNYRREIIVLPKDFKINNPEADELNTDENKKRYKIRLRFSLPKGSYATVVTKGIFLK